MVTGWKMDTSPWTSCKLETGPQPSSSNTTASLSPSNQTPPHPSTKSTSSLSHLSTSSSEPCNQQQVWRPQWNIPTSKLNSKIVCLIREKSSWHGLCHIFSSSPLSKVILFLPFPILLIREQKPICFGFPPNFRHANPSNLSEESVFPIFVCRCLFHCLSVVFIWHKFSDVCKIMTSFVVSDLKTPLLLSRTLNWYIPLLKRSWQLSVQLIWYL